MFFFRCFSQPKASLPRSGWLDVPDPLRCTRQKRKHQDLAPHRGPKVGRNPWKNTVLCWFEGIWHDLTKKNGDVNGNKNTPFSSMTFPFEFPLIGYFPVPRLIIGGFLATPKKDAAQSDIWKMPLGKWSSNYHPSGTLVSLGVAIRWWHNDILNRCLGCTWWPWKWRSLADYWLKMTSIAYSWWILLQNGSGKTSPREPRCSKWLHRRPLEFWSPANGTTDTSIKTGVFRAKKLGNTRSKSRSRKIMFLCCAVLTGSGWICRWSMTKQRPAIHYHPCLNSSFIFLILSKSNKNPPGLVRGYNFPGLCGPADFGGSVKEDPGSSVSHHRRHRRHGWRPRRPWGGSVSWRLSHAATLQGPTKGRGRGGTSSGSHGCCWVEQFQKKQLHGQWSSSSIPSDPFQIHFTEGHLSRD